MLLSSQLWTCTNLVFHSGELYKVIHLKNILSNSGWVKTLKNAITNWEHIGTLIRYDQLPEWGLANTLKRK